MRADEHHLWRGLGEPDGQVRADHRGKPPTQTLPAKKDDFAYNKSATKEYPEGFIVLYGGDELAAVPNSIFTCFRINGESPVPKYLNYLFLGNLHGRWLRKFIEVGARAHGSLSINEDDLLALPVPLPRGGWRTTENRRVPEFGGRAMAAQARKVDALKTHKKGLMQQLFPREGETQPRLRFPDFQKAGEWVCEELSSCLKKVIDYRGIAPPKLGIRCPANHCEKREVRLGST